MKILKSIAVIFLLSQFLVTSGCKFNGTETGDPSVTLRLSAFDSSQAHWTDLLIPKAFAAVGNIQMCIHQIRFKADNSADNPGENGNFSVGYVEWISSGTDLGGIDVAPGVYRRIDIMVKDQCGLGFGLSVMNDNGLFQITQPEILRFEGEFEIGADGDDLVLNVPLFIDFFETVEDDDELFDGIGDVIGDF